ILLDGLPWQQLVEFLEHDHAVGAGAADRQPLEAHAAFGGRHVAADRLEQGRLAATGGTEQHEAVGAIDVGAGAIGGGDAMGLGIVLRGDAADGQQRRGLRWSIHGWPPWPAEMSGLSQGVSCPADYAVRERTGPASSPA